MRPLVLANGLLLLAIAAAIVGVQLLDRGNVAVEAAVVRYATAVTLTDRSAALAELTPDARDTWASWVQLHLGERYDVRAVSVRSHSLLDRWLHGASAAPFEVTVVMDVNRGAAEGFYQPTTHVPVRQVDGRWYLAEPLLGPESG